MLRRRLARLRILLPLLLVGAALLPLINDPFYSDAEHVPYENVARSPNPVLDPARSAIADTKPYIDNFGRFQPLGRAFRAYATSSTVRIAVLMGVSPHIVWGLMRCLFGMGAAYGALLLARSFTELGGTRSNAVNQDRGESRRVTEPARDRLVWPVCVAFSFGMIAAGLTGAPVFSPSDYLAVVLVIGGPVRWVARPELWVARPNLSVHSLGTYLGAVTLGAVLVAWGEVSAIAVPIVVLWVILMLWARRSGVRNTLTSFGSVCAGLLIGSFLLATVAVRMTISGACAQGGCYRYSEFGITSDTPSVLVWRIWSSVPPVRFGWAIADVSDYLSIATIAIGIIVSVWVVMSLTRRPSVRSTPIEIEKGHSAPGVAPVLPTSSIDRTATIGLLVAGAALVVLSELVPAVSLGFQEAAGRIGVGQAWRNSAVSAAGWALILTSGWMDARDRLSTRSRRAAMASVAAFWVLVPMTNAAFASRSSATRSGRINSSIAEAFVHNDDPSATKCDLIRAWAALPPTAGGSADPANRFDFMSSRLNGARRSMGLPDFCPSGGVGTPESLTPGT